MRIDPRMLLRGLGKFVAVVVVAGLAGAGIGIGLAKLSGDDASSDPVLPATTARTSTAPPARTQTTGGRAPATAGTQTTASAGKVYRVPRVQVLDARLFATNATPRVTVQVRVTNRGTRPLVVKAPVLISGPTEVPLDKAREAARSLLRSIPAGASATGTLRFTTRPAVSERLSATPRARLRIARRTISLKLTAKTTAR